MASEKKYCCTDSCGMDRYRALAGTCACFNLRRSARIISQIFDQELKPSGLKITQFSLLAAAFISERLILNKLAEVLGMERTTLSRNLKLLEKKGMVELTQGEDKRAVNIQLTPKGLEALDKAFPLWAKAQARVTGNLPEGKWESLLADLRGICSQAK